MSIIFNEKQINKAIKSIAKSINANNNENTVFICLLNGGFLYFSELVKLINDDIECDFLRVKSYKNKRTQGELKIIKDIEVSIEGKNIFIVDDLLDSGNTIKEVINHLKNKKPKQINVTTLLKRKSSPSLNYNFYYGLEIEDEWIAGMGMDDEKGFKRNHKIIYKV